MSPTTENGLQQLSAARESLSGIIQSLEADGYKLSLESIEDETLTARVTALAGACEDCLVPKSIMQDIVLHALSGAMPMKRVDLTYPNEHH